MMDEEFRSDVLDSAFHAFRDGDGSLPVPLGPAAVRATVRRRRQARAGLTGGLTALLIAAPVAAYAAGMIDTNGPPADPATQPPKPPPSATASPSPSPSASASPQSSEGAASPPDGRIDLATLGQSTLKLAPWPYLSKTYCPSGDVTFSGGKAPHLAGGYVPSSGLEIDRITHVDIDSDGAEETAAVVNCHGIEYGEYQVVVLDRDADGRIVTLGTALFTSSDMRGESGLPLAIRGFEARGDELAVEVGDKRACCGQNPAVAQWQWRTFRYSGTEFVQTGGPTEFGPNPLVTDLKVVSATIEGTTTGDTFTGTLKITVRNAGPFQVNGFTAFSLPRPATLKTVPIGCERNDTAVLGPDPEDRDFAYFCAMGPTAPGEEITLETFQITGPAADFVVGDQKTIMVEVFGGIDGTKLPDHFGRLPDVNHDNNFVSKTFTVK